MSVEKDYFEIKRFKTEVLDADVEVFDPPPDQRVIVSEIVFWSDINGTLLLKIGATPVIHKIGRALADTTVRLTDIEALIGGSPDFGEKVVIEIETDGDTGTEGAAFILFFLKKRD